MLPYKDVVFEIENDFIPSNTSDLGGILFKRGNQKQEFEYTNGVGYRSHTLS